MRSMLPRFVSVVGVLFLFVGLAAAPAAALPTEARAAVPAAAPQLPTDWDWIGAVKCGSTFLPNMPKGNVVECVKQAVKGAEKAGDAVKDGAGTAAKALANTVLGDAAKSMAEFATEFVEVTFTWWLMTDSVQIKDSGVLGDPDANDPTKSLSLHAIMVGIGAGIATILVMFQGIRMIIQRKGAPLAQIIQGLLLNVVVSAAGVGVIDALLIASDQLTKAILYVGFGGDTDVPARMAALLLPTIGNPMGLLTIALIALIVSGVQVVMLFLRQAAIPIQALLLPVAGAGQVGGDSSRQWLPRLFTAIAVVITYKPMAALIISVGFTEMAYGNGIIDFIRGVVTLVLSIFALKSLLALFAPLGLSMGNAVAAGGGLGGALSMMGGAMASQTGGSGGDGGAGGGGGGSTAASHAADMERNRPSSGGDDSSEGSSAIQQASGNVPQQGGNAAAAGGESAAAAEGASAAAGAGQAAAAGGSTAAASGATAAAGGPVTLALVAAEAGKQAANKAGGAVGGTE